MSKFSTFELNDIQRLSCFLIGCISLGWDESSYAGTRSTPASACAGELKDYLLSRASNDTPFQTKIVTISTHLATHANVTYCRGRSPYPFLKERYDHVELR